MHGIVPFQVQTNKYSWALWLGRPAQGFQDRPGPVLPSWLMSKCVVGSWFDRPAQGCQDRLGPVLPSRWMSKCVVKLWFDRPAQGSQDRFGPVLPSRWMSKCVVGSWFDHPDTLTRLSIPLASDNLTRPSSDPIGSPLPIPQVVLHHSV